MVKKLTETMFVCDICKTVKISSYDGSDGAVNALIKKAEAEGWTIEVKHDNAVCPLCGED